MHDTLRLVSSDDVGRDEASVQSLLKKHKDVTDELKNYQSVIEALHEQAANLGEQVLWHLKYTVKNKSGTKRYVKCFSGEPFKSSINEC